MKIIKIDLNKPGKSIIEKASIIIKSGGIVVFPSDTSYGIASDPLNNESYRKVYSIKQRDPNQPISFIFKVIQSVEKVINLTKEQVIILEKNLPGPFTFVVKNNTSYFKHSFTIGIRIPNSPITQSLSKHLDNPYTATSANLSGQHTCYSVKEFLDQIQQTGIKPDLILDAGTLPTNPPSTVINIEDPFNPYFIRRSVYKPIL